MPHLSAFDRAKRAVTMRAAVPICEAFVRRARARFTYAPPPQVPGADLWPTALEDELAEMRKYAAEPSR